MAVEAWSDIPNTDYSVSDEGWVASRKRGEWRILRPATSRKGYLVVRLYHNGDGKMARVHRLVASAFLPDAPTPGHELNHKDGNKANNRADNLEWVTSSENTRHYLRVIGNKSARGERAGTAKLAPLDVLTIRRELAGGTSQSEIARRRKMHPSSICDIANRNTWNHI